MSYPAGLTVKVTKVHILPNCSTSVSAGRVFNGKLHFDIFPGKQLLVVGRKGNALLETSPIVRIQQTQDEEWIVETSTSIYLVQQC